MKLSWKNCCYFLGICWLFLYAQFAHCQQLSFVTELSPQRLVFLLSDSLTTDKAALKRLHSVIYVRTSLLTPNDLAALHALHKDSLRFGLILQAPQPEGNTTFGEELAGLYRTFQRLPLWDSIRWEGILLEPPVETLRHASRAGNPTDTLPPSAWALAWNGYLRLWTDSRFKNEQTAWGNTVRQIRQDGHRVLTLTPELLLQESQFNTRAFRRLTGIPAQPAAFSVPVLRADHSGSPDRLLYQYKQLRGEFPVIMVLPGSQPEYLTIQDWENCMAMASNGRHELIVGLLEHFFRKNWITRIDSIGLPVVEPETLPGTAQQIAASQTRTKILFVLLDYPFVLLIIAFVYLWLLLRLMYRILARIFTG